MTFSSPNCLPSSVNVSIPSFSLTSDIQTFAPFCNNRIANSFPNPLADPVTIATLPLMMHNEDNRYTLLATIKSYKPHGIH